MYINFGRFYGPSLKSYRLSIREVRMVPKNCMPTKSQGIRLTSCSILALACSYSANEHWK